MAGRRVASLCLLAIVVCGCGGSNQAAAPTTTVAPRPKPRPLPPNTIRIHWHKDALVPAPRAGRVCIVTVRTGHICARYRLAQIPAVQLKKKLLTKGIHVQDVP